MRKNMKFWPLNPFHKRSDWKTWLSERFSEALTSKLWNEKEYMLPKLTEMEWNWIMFFPYGFIKNLWQIHLRNRHVKFTGKHKVGNTMWGKLRNLIGEKQKKTVFSKPTQKTFLSVSGKQASRQAGKQVLGLLFSYLRFLDTFQSFRLIF